MKLSNKNKNNDPILEYWIAFDLHMKFLYFKILQNNLFVRVDPFSIRTCRPRFPICACEFLSFMFTCLLYLFKTILLLTFFYHH